MYVIKYQVRDYLFYFFFTNSTNEILIALKPSDTTSYFYTVVDF